MHAYYVYYALDRLMGFCVARVDLKLLVRDEYIPNGSTVVASAAVLFTLLRKKPMVS